MYKEIFKNIKNMGKVKKEKKVKEIAIDRDEDRFTPEMQEKLNEMEANN